MSTVSYNEQPDEVGLSLGAAWMDFNLSTFMAHLDQEELLIYDGADGCLVISVD